MRYTPSDRHGSLLLGSLKTAAKEHCEDKDLANEVLTNAAEHLQAREDETPAQVFKTVNHEMSEYFMKWAEALSSGDHHKANHYSDQIDELAEHHPFTYADTKNIFWNNYKASTYTQAKNNYRDADPKNLDFGKISKCLDPNATVGIFGDWGTGTQDTKVLFKAMLSHKPDVLLHLGDIYEAGMPLEIEEHFLQPIDEVCKDIGITRPPIFTIPGNHEYFSGGKGYFELIDVLNPDIDAGWAQEASFFCLQSSDKKWQFLGADTGLGCIDDPSTPGLEDAEADWHRAWIEKFPGKTVFLTHHQFVSADQGIYHHRPSGTHYDYRYFNPNLVDTFDQPIQSGGTETYLDKITLWMWGHDHYFIPYAPDLTIPKIDHSRTGGQRQPKLPLGQLLGGSARETKVSHRSVSSSRWSWTQTDNAGKPIRPDATNQNIVNHTYAVMKIGTGQISYYQVPAWYGTVDLKSPPSGINVTPDPTPLLTNRL